MYYQGISQVVFSLLGLSIWVTTTTIPGVYAMVQLNIKGNNESKFNNKNSIDNIQRMMANNKLTHHHKHHEHSRRSFAAMATATLLGTTAGIVTATAVTGSIDAAEAADLKFKRIPTQFIAALGDPKASFSETGAQDWGLWEVDPGPRGVFLKDFASSKLSKTGTGPYGWKFQPNDWWLEEHGLIMESPDFPVSPGRYVVTGGREVTTILTINEQGGWDLRDGTLYDVTHLPCRSARYTGDACSPTKANPSKFPVRPGATMPAVNGCEKQDYAVLFVIGVEDVVKSSEL